MMYAGDDYYGDEITSPIYRPVPSLRLAVAARGDCPACGGTHHIQHCPTIAALLNAPESIFVRGLAACLEASRRPRYDRSKPLPMDGTDYHVFGEE